jgi:hypothetical protein
LPLAVQLTTAAKGGYRGRQAHRASWRRMRWQAVEMGNGLVLPVFAGEDGVEVRRVAATGIACCIVIPDKSENVDR